MLHNLYLRMSPSSYFKKHFFKFTDKIIRKNIPEQKSPGYINPRNFFAF